MKFREISLAGEVPVVIELLTRSLENKLGAKFFDHLQIDEVDTHKIFFLKNRLDPGIHNLVIDNINRCS